MQHELTVLDITSNKISKIENVSHLTNLTELWVRRARTHFTEALSNESNQASDNEIPTLHDLEKILGGAASLETVYLEGNPCQKGDMANYRRKVMLALPQLKQIDATYVKIYPSEV